jgi:hypothetical protein
MVLKIGNAANLFFRLGFIGPGFVRLALALVAGVGVGLTGFSAMAEDITWYGPFDPPGPLFAGGPRKTADCEPTPGSQAAWYRFCQCPGTTGTTACTVSYYSTASYSCSGPPPKTIALVTMRGTTKTACNDHEVWATAMAMNTLTGMWPGEGYPPPQQPPDPNGTPLPPKEPPDPGGGRKIGGLEVPAGQDKPDDNTALKTDEKKTASTENKETKTNETKTTETKKDSGTQTEEKQQPPVRATRDPATGKLILDGPLGDQSMHDAPKSPNAPQVAATAGGAMIDPKTVSDAQLKALLADPQFRSRVVKLLGDDSASKQTVSKGKPSAAQRPANTNNANSGVSPEGAAAAGVLLGVGVGVGVGLGAGRMGGDR